MKQISRLGSLIEDFWQKKLNSVHLPSDGKSLGPFYFRGTRLTNGIDDKKTADHCEDTRGGGGGSEY
jgi:hypothetical protein